MNCPFCGAEELKFAPYDTYYGDKPRYECNTTFRGIAGDYCLANQLRAAKAEIEQLRDKKAEGLTWEECDDGLKAFSFFGRRYLILVNKHCANLLNPATGFWTTITTIDAAKAHAEELHQQAWRELRNKWDAK